MRKIMVVAVREYSAAVKTKAFLITLIAMPILMGGGIVAQVLLEGRVDTGDRKIAIVDYSGQLYGPIAQAAAKRNDEDIFKKNDDGETTSTQNKPKFILTQYRPTGAFDDAKANAELQLKLSELVRKKEFFAFAIIPPDAMSPADDGEEAVPIAYHSNTPTYNDLVDWMRGVINSKVKQYRFGQAGLNLAVVTKALAPVPIDNLNLVTRDESGQITKAVKSNRAANFMIPMAMMMLMLMVVMVGASPLVQTVLEEKMQRIAEVLLGSIPPFQLMMGKLLGTVGVSLTISTVYLGGSFAAVSYAGYGSMFPTHLLVWFVVFQSLAVLLFGSVFIAVGAAVTDLKESQSLLSPVMVLIMAPLFVWPNIIKEPNATFSVLLSLFPPATPMLMLVRQAVPPGVPLWQPLLGIVLVLLTTVIFVIAAGRIFRVGLLMQGKGAKFSEIIRWVISG